MEHPPHKGILADIRVRVVDIPLLQHTRVLKRADNIPRLRLIGDLVHADTQLVLIVRKLVPDGFQTTAMQLVVLVRVQEHGYGTR
jgi:hypothetical protein